jgi:transcriptional regulator with XRE-family HTH domain
MQAPDISRVCDFSESVQSVAMATGWRDRLEKAVKDSGRSYRDISLAAGLGESYVSELFRKDIDPTLGKLQAICDELGVSFTFITQGVRITPEMEELLGVWATLSAGARDALVRQSHAERGGADAPPAPGGELPKRGSKARAARSQGRH